MDNRTYLLEEALRLFAERGYDAIGVQEICLAAGVTKPTLYHYFGSKRGLLETLIHERSSRLLALVEAGTTYRGDLPESLRRLTTDYFYFARDEATFCRLHLALWFATPSHEAFGVVADLNIKLQHLVEGLFVAATEDHGNMRHRHQRYAASLLGTINTYVALHLNGYVTLNEEVARQLVQQFSYGIYS